METGEKIRSGNIRAASRLIRDIEDGEPGTKEILKQIYPHTGGAHIIGFTGPPGAGKSTLIDALIRLLRKRNLRVGVLAIDPSSPFTGGAILGDRIRMQKHASDPGVFIRRLSTRGSLGGLSRAAGNAIHIMDAMGMDYILIETVGAGQQEVDIINHAHTVLVVMVPGLGDEIQIMKAGILEIADVFVINKAHFDGGAKLNRELLIMIDMSPIPKGDWRPPVLQIKDLEEQAAYEAGIGEVFDNMEKHRKYLVETEHMGKRMHRKMTRELEEALSSAILDPVLRAIADTGELECIIEKLVKKETDPVTVSEEIANKYLRPE
ncbi:MAG: methylmalonyl Co-A mutase-associated GTPase MeaB [Syntrophales bacterium]|nr:methylmalonyl Co-A mutase-associated GTPase MeaB [Syntrophales bacterium]